MQPIEKALFKVIDEGLDSNYVYPQNEYLDDVFKTGNQIVNPFFGQNPQKIKFGYGTKKELDIWLKDTTEKYPLVWLVYPLEEVYTNNPQSFYTYPRARLIFAINNTSDKLVNTRVQTTRFVLDQITGKFSELMITSKFKKFIYVDKIVNVKETFRPNYSYNESQDKSATIDVWDAITYDCDLHLIPNCIPKN